MDYERYDAPETTETMDEVGTAVVLSETCLHLRKHWRRAKVFCWWLSIDNSPYFATRRWMENARMDGAAGSNLSLARAVVGSHRRVVRDRPWLAGITHLTQSKYAWDYLHKALWVLPTMLGDYIPDANSGVMRTASTLSIAYNPAKGRELTDEVRSLSDPSLTWLPIEGLSHAGVGALLDRATVYLESGHQPGKDRIPREAALHGCVILMLRKGAGRNIQDCPLADAYRIQPGPLAAGRFAGALSEVFADVAHHRAMQQPYLDMVVSDQAVFDRAVKGIFVDGQRGIDNWRGPTFELRGRRGDTGR